MNEWMVLFQATRAHRTETHTHTHTDTAPNNKTISKKKLYCDIITWLLAYTCISAWISFCRASNSQPSNRQSYLLSGRDSVDFSLDRFRKLDIDRDILQSEFSEFYKSIIILARMDLERAVMFYIGLLRKTSKASILTAELVALIRSWTWCNSAL